MRLAIDKLPELKGWRIPGEKFRDGHPHGDLRHCAHET